MGTIPKVVIDTNVFISAFGWDGKPESLLLLLEQRRILNYTTDDIFDELRRVVAYPKLRFSASLQTKILEFAFCWSTFVKPDKTVWLFTPTLMMTSSLLALLLPRQAISFPVIPICFLLNPTKTFVYSRLPSF